MPLDLTSRIPFLCLTGRACSFAPTRRQPEAVLDVVKDALRAPLRGGFAILDDISARLQAGGGSGGTDDCGVGQRYCQL
jgi:hypothetical protein